MPEPGEPRGTTAVLVVHGIGAQNRGETLGKVLAGLARVDPDGVPLERQDGAAGSIGGQPVRFYEVYWADLLKGSSTKGAFEMNELQSLSWFPWFNFRHKAYREPGYSPVVLAWWWVVLPLVNFLILLGYFGARFLSQLLWQTGGEREEVAGDSSLRRVMRKAGGGRVDRTRLDTLLDEYLGDVFSYVNSAEGTFYRSDTEPQPPEAAKDVFQRIVGLFQERLLQAHADGCDRVQVIAHSLGTVVTFHAVAGWRSPPATADKKEALAAAFAKIDHLYTLGCPLEKIRFFWPRLIPGSDADTVERPKWDNLVSWFDPVAGRMKRFGHWGDVTNTRLLGGGFFRGHVVYESSPTFLRVFTKGLCGRALEAPRSLGTRWSDRLLLVGETLAAPLALGVILAAGAALFALTAALLPWLLSWILRLFLEDATWGPIIDGIAAVMLGMMVFVFLLNPLIRARRVHARFRQRSAGDEG